VLIVMTMLTVITKVITRLYRTAALLDYNRNHRGDVASIRRQVTLSWIWPSGADDIHVYLSLATVAVSGGNSLPQIHHIARTSRLAIFGGSLTRHVHL
jgi:hypothetical protein